MNKIYKIIAFCMIFMYSLTTFAQVEEYKPDKISKPQVYTVNDDEAYKRVYIVVVDFHDYIVYREYGPSGSCSVSMLHSQSCRQQDCAILRKAMIKKAIETLKE